ncbi:MaoC/PaaZ C-terminal domain-containing protein [Enterobacter hormaechei]
MVHGYFLISAAAGLFVDAGLAGYCQLRHGKPRFIEPVKPGDTIQVRLTCKRKTLKKQRTAEETDRRGGMGCGDLQPAPAGRGALLILTLVARQQGDF